MTYDVYDFSKLDYHLLKSYFKISVSELYYIIKNLKTFFSTDYEYIDFESYICLPELKQSIQEVDNIFKSHSEKNISFLENEISIIVECFEFIQLLFNKIIPDFIKESFSISLLNHKEKEKLCLISSSIRSGCSFALRIEDLLNKV